MLGQFEFYWFFHGLMISEKNINKNNIKWFTKNCSSICRTSVFTKKTCVLTDICWGFFFLFLVFYFPRSCLVLVAYSKTNISCHFCLISKLFTFGNVIYNSTSRCWILITSGEYFRISNKKAWNICLLFSDATKFIPF